MENYAEIRNRAKKLYLQKSPVICPKLNGESVTFNSSGFRHLIGHGKKMRRQREQLRRFALLPHVENVLTDTSAKVVQTKKEGAYTFDRHGHKAKRISQALFWRFSSRQNGRMVNVIVRQVGNGQKHFFSVF